MCTRACVREGERKSVCVCACVRERGRKSVCVFVCETESECVCVCVCVCTYPAGSVGAAAGVCSALRSSRRGLMDECIQRCCYQSVPPAK